MSFSLLKPVAVAAFLVAAGSSQAAMTVYTSQAAFLAAISASGVDTFDDLDYTAPLQGPISRTAGAYSYTATTTTANSFFPASDDGSDVWLGSNTRTDVITLSGFSSGVSAVGGYFFGSNVSGLYASATSITITGTDASGTMTETILSPTQGSFLGFVSTGDMSSLTFTVGDQAASDGSNGIWPTLNNLTLGTAAVAAVPEPETYALMFGGLGVVGWMARRRKTVA